MLEKEILRFERELGEIKHDLLKSAAAPELEDEESYRMATQLDLTVARLLRLLEYR